MKKGKAKIVKSEWIIILLLTRVSLGIEKGNRIKILLIVSLSLLFISPSLIIISHAVVLLLQVLRYFDYVFTGVFTFEMLIKVTK